MLKKIFRWNILRRRFRLSRESLLDDGRRRVRRVGRKHYYFAGDGYSTYEKPARRHFFRYLFIALALLSLFAWFVQESYQGWGLFAF